MKTFFLPTVIYGKNSRQSVWFLPLSVDFAHRMNIGCTRESGLRRNLLKVHYTFSSYPKISSKTVLTLNMIIINEFKYCYVRKQLFIHLLTFFHQNLIVIGCIVGLYSNRFAHKSISLSYVCLNHRFRHIRGMRVTIRRGSNLTFALFSKKVDAIGRANDMLREPIWYLEFIRYVSVLSAGGEGMGAGGFFLGGGQRSIVV